MVPTGHNRDLVDVDHCWHFGHDPSNRSCVTTGVFELKLVAVEGSKHSSNTRALGADDELINVLPAIGVARYDQRTMLLTRDIDRPIDPPHPNLCYALHFIVRRREHNNDFSHVCLLMGLFPNTALDTFDCNAAEPKVRKVNNSGAIVSFSNQGANRPLMALGSVVKELTIEYFSDTKYNTNPSTVHFSPPTLATFPNQILSNIIRQN
ncbi:MAG: hypothetical protein UU04_C0019G0010 [Candidatus Uhrbacteria bacterium GW2011_GWC2_40_450]|nr:MAG: hypothetical protein UU04_C0019G0010 [Candidatus Uhrbacteria bacterium GW2011_GWC2_40_450]